MKDARDASHSLLDHQPRRRRGVTKKRLFFINFITLAMMLYAQKMSSQRQNETKWDEWNSNCNLQISLLQSRPFIGKRWTPTLLGKFSKQKLFSKELLFEFMCRNFDALHKLIILKKDKNLYGVYQIGPKPTFYYESHSSCQRQNQSLKNALDFAFVMVE